MISCQSYIDRVLHAHGWNNHKKKLSKKLSPLLDACLKTIYKECGPDEATVDAFKLKLSQGFAYPTLLGEMMYVYVTWCPAIDYESTTMSKFSTKPSKYHYELLKGIVKYLQETNEWGIKYTCSIGRTDLSPESLISLMLLQMKPFLLFLWTLTTYTGGLLLTLLMLTINANNNLLLVLCSLIVVVQSYTVPKPNLFLLLVPLKLIFCCSLMCKDYVVFEVDLI